MKFKTLNLLSILACSHDFAWPRSTATDTYSQVCRLCGAEYEYDWKEMRRKKRIVKAVEMNAHEQAKVQALVKGNENRKGVS